jgi:hypothetical protein
VESTSIRRWIRTSRGRIVVVSAGLALVVGVAVLAVFLRDDDAAHPVQASAVVPALPASAAPPAVEAATSAAAPLAADLSGPEEVQICGGAWLTAEADGRVSADEAKAFNQHATELARAQTLAAMAASSDERAQAAAHLYQSVIDRSQQLCASTGQCVQPSDALQGSTDPEVTVLVQLAQSSTDPQVYAWAYRACVVSGSSAESPCQLVTTEQWARLDPTNAMPWLFMAAEADKRGDADGVNDAMFHVANAERQDTGWGALVAQVIQHAPAGDAHLGESLNLVFETLGIEASAPGPYAMPSKYCGVGNLADANRRETCEGIATVLLQKSRTLLDRGIGLGIARRLGWPPEQIKSLEDEQEALSAAVGSATPHVIDEGSCAELHHALDHFRDLGVYGELETARRAVAASGKPVWLLAADSRRARGEDARRLRKEEAVAAAASASEN